MTPAEVQQLDLPGWPKTRFRVSEKLNRIDFLRSRPRSDQGGGVEYEVSCLGIGVAGAQRSQIVDVELLPRPAATESVTTHKNAAVKNILRLFEAADMGDYNGDRATKFVADWNQNQVFAPAWVRETCPVLNRRTLFLWVKNSARNRQSAPARCCVMPSA